MFVVVPYISSDQTIYGIYGICLSVTIFLSYADLGFLSAAHKFAAECLVQNDRKGEMGLIGFSHFILLIIVALLGGVFVYLSFHPHLLISGITAGAETQVASKLLLILGLSAPLVIIQRALQLIFGIRLEEFRLQRINIGGSIVKIASVFYFFEGGRYDIVGYFLFLQLISLAVALVGVWYARRAYSYDFGALVRSVRYNSAIFKKTRALALATLLATISWVLYYELDSVAIGKLLGADAAAIYAIGFTLLTFIRSIFGTIFSPFAARFNHFVGAGDWEGLRRFYLHVMVITFPLVVFPLVGLVLMAQGIIVSWVGPTYTASVVVAQWLLLCNILGFLNYPTNLMLVAHNDIKKLNKVSLLMPVVFWGGVFATIGSYGVVSFAFFKWVAFMFSSVVLFFFALKLTQLKWWAFLLQIVVPYLPALLLLVLALWWVQDIWIDGKNKLHLLYNALVVGGGIVFALGVSVCTVAPLRDYAKGLIKQFTKR